MIPLIYNILRLNPNVTIVSIPKIIIKVLINFFDFMLLFLMICKYNINYLNNQIVN